MKNELKQIIQELKEVIKDENLNIIDRDILDFSLRLFNTNQINDSKKPFYSGKQFANQDKKELNNLNNEKPKPDFEPPSQAQIKACKKIGIIIPNGASKLDVWKLMNKKE